MGGDARLICEEERVRTRISLSPWSPEIQLLEVLGVLDGLPGEQHKWKIVPLLIAAMGAREVEAKGPVTTAV